jgi:hypothetical protein
MQRTHQYQATAVELFFRDRTTLLLNFPEVRIAKQFQRKLDRRLGAVIKKPALTDATVHSRMVFESSLKELQTQWVLRNIDNFTYLMHLNRLAGRSYKDLSQYPVLPWVLSDYTSERLDLTNPDSFRDLRYPMGAQRRDQREALRVKYDELKNMFDDCPEMATIPPHHHGTHYSNMAFVLWYARRSLIDVLCIAEWHATGPFLDYAN